MHIKRILALVLALLMLSAVFSSCGEEPAADVTETPAPEADAENAADAAGEGADESTARALALTSKAALELSLEPDSTVAWLEGSGISWRELAHWLDISCEYYEYSYGAITDWDEDLGGMTVSEYILYDATEMALLYHAVEAFAESQGVTVTEADREEIEAARQEDIAYYGGEEEYRAALERDGLTEELFSYMNTVSCLYNNAFIDRYGAAGEACPDDEVLAYAEISGFMCAKHILLKVPEGATEDEKAEIKARMDEMHAQISAAADPAAEFEALLAEYGEDPGMESFPEGYTFGPGEMVSGFEDGTAALEPGGISGVIESSYGYHIIMRLPLGLDGMTLDSIHLDDLLRLEAALTLFDMELAEFIEGCEISYEPVYAEIVAAEMLG